MPMHVPANHDSHKPDLNETKTTFRPHQFQTPPYRHLHAPSRGKLHPDTDVLRLLASDDFLEKNPTWKDKC